MKRLKYLLLFIPMLLLSGCNGCNDGVLGTACSWRSEAHVFCEGAEDDFIYLELTTEEKLNYEAGICKVGRVHCLERITTLEEYCPINSNKCINEWNKNRYSDVCIGNVLPIEEDCGDGLDNNCDGQIDESVTTSFYRDDDGDGWGTSDPEGIQDAMQTLKADQTATTFGSHIIGICSLFADIIL